MCGGMRLASSWCGDMRFVHMTLAKVTRCGWPHGKVIRCGWAHGRYIKLLLSSAALCESAEVHSFLHVATGKGPALTRASPALLSKPNPTPKPTCGTRSRVTLSLLPAQTRPALPYRPTTLDQPITEHQPDSIGPTRSPTLISNVTTH